MSTEENALVRVKGVSKSFRRGAEEIHVLADLELEVKNGAEWTPVPFGKIIADEGRVQATNTKQLWTIDASRDEVRLPRQLVHDRCRHQRRRRLGLHLKGDVLTAASAPAA